jgi:hypothetical protein
VPNVFKIPDGASKANQAPAHLSKPCYLLSDRIYKCGSLSTSGCVSALIVLARGSPEGELFLRVTPACFLLFESIVWLFGGYSNAGVSG